MSALIIHSTVYEDGGAIAMARVLGNAGTAIVQADISSISFAAYELSDDGATATEILAPSALTVSSVVFDTMQTGDPRWTEDGTGYNFLHAVPATAFPSGNKLYRLEYKFTPASGQPFFVLATVRSIAVYMS